MTDAVWCEMARDFVAVRGPDAESFLQGQCSQDVLAIDTASSAWSFVLQPSGKVDALVRIHRVNDQTFVLDLDGGSGAALLARLQRFKIRVKVELDVADWRCIAVRGAAIPLGPGVLASWWGRPDAVDLVGTDVVPPDGARPTDQDGLERLRVEAGWPAMGHELTPDTIPAESGVVGVAASFTKGCYTGQELVARIDSRGGHVPRHLRHVRVPAGASIDPGERILADGKDVGWSTSVAGDLALAYVGRALVPPATAFVGEVPVTVEAIPGR